MDNAMLNSQFYSRYGFHRFYVIPLAAVILMCGTTHAFSQAACPDFSGTPVNESYEIDPELIKAAIKDGCPPPQNWLTRGNGFAEAPTSAMFGSLGLSNLFAHTPARTYKDRGCITYDETKAGGFTDDGAKTACELGVGRGLFTLAPIKPNVPEVAQEEVDCLTNLVTAIGGLLSGGGTGNLGISATGSVSGNCASGSIGICGIGSIGGQICTNGDRTATDNTQGLPYSQNTPPKYVEVNDITQYDYANTDLNQATSIFFPNGGVLTYDNNNFNIEVGGFVTMDDAGNVFVGKPAPDYGYTPIAGYGTTDGITLQPNEYVSLIPTDGILQIDSSLLQGKTIDGTGTLLTSTTTQGAYVPAGSAGQVTSTSTPSTGASATPDGSLVTDPNAPYAGAFPVGTVNNEVPVDPNTGAAAVPQQ
jgi:hypothetical protein